LNEVLKNSISSRM